MEIKKCCEFVHFGDVAEWEEHIVVEHGDKQLQAIYALHGVTEVAKAFHAAKEAAAAAAGQDPVKKEAAAAAAAGQDPVKKEAAAAGQDAVKKAAAAAAREDAFKKKEAAAEDAVKVEKEAAAEDAVKVEKAAPVEDAVEEEEEVAPVEDAVEEEEAAAGEGAWTADEEEAHRDMVREVMGARAQDEAEERKAEADLAAIESRKNKVREEADTAATQKAAIRAGKKNVKPVAKKPKIGLAPFRRCV